MHHEPEKHGNTFLSVAAIVLRRWKIVAVVAVATTLAGLAASVLGRASYVTSTTMVPFAGSQARSGLALAGLPPGVAGLVGGSSSSPTDRLVGVILNSHTLADSMVGRLSPRFATEAEVRETLAKRTRVLRSIEGAVTIQVRAADADLALRMANTYPALLNDAMVRLTSEGAVRRQTLIESQMTVARERLVRSEQRLLAFQRNRSVPNVDQQATRTLDAAADLHRRVLDQELRVAELRRSLVPGHPQLQVAEGSLATLRTQLRRVSQGSGPAFVPLGEGGELKLASARLEREFAQDQQLYQSLTGALTEAQLDAHNNLPVLTVLDSARAPVRAGSPVRAGQMAAIFGVVLGVALALAGEALRRARINPDNAGFFAAWGQFRRDLRLGGGRRKEMAHGD
jgi:uncharacterized protein involved in exopolysaccharide biosynthesis